MSDHYSGAPPESMRRPGGPMFTAGLVVVYVVLGIGPPLLAWFTGSPDWFAGWLLLLIFWSAG